MGHIKAAVYEGIDLPWSRRWRRTEARLENLGTHDAKEGLAAFARTEAELLEQLTGNGTDT